MVHMPAIDIERFVLGDVALALHRWVPEEVRGVIYYVHGIQSHGGWLFETGPFLAERGIALYALDRRGSGRSEGQPGNSEFEVWLDDYAAGLRRVRAAHPGVPLTILGQSFGGAVASALAVHDVDPEYDALVLVAPAINQLRVPGTSQANFIARPGEAVPALPALVETAFVPIPIDDRQYTSDPRYLAFMRDDAQMLRTISKNHRRAQIGLAARYMTGAAVLARKACLLVLPRTDTVVSLELARATFEYLVPHGFVIQIPTDDHYLEFTNMRAAYLELLAAIAASAPRLRST
jgi:alpha-beta hydrolase superfamily lysophospholipase